MKIGIITFWNSQDNYGQLLQCFALQYYLRHQGHEVFLVRYIPEVKTKTIKDRIFDIWNLLTIKHINAYMHFLVNKKKSRLFNADHPRYFDEFRQKYIQLSSKIYNNFDELKNENWDAEAFICGSDQIWSYSNVEDNIRAFFLEFVHKSAKSIAYAASFGRAELPTDYTEMLPRLLSKFHAVSLREDAGVDLCIKANRLDAQLVCDPTILLKVDDYLATFINKKIVQTNSIFCYLLNWETDLPIDEINAYLYERQLEMNFIGAHGMEHKKLFPMMNNLTIESWLESMCISKYVFTNSYHGTVFSILMKKPFIVFPLKGISDKMNGRLTTLLLKIGLEDRIYKSDKSITDILNMRVQWDSVELKINEFRMNSELFLIESLK
jgi:hypothetical protein